MNVRVTKASLLALLLAVGIACGPAAAAGEPVIPQPPVSIQQQGGEDVEKLSRQVESLLSEIRVLDRRVKTLEQQQGSQPTASPNSEGWASVDQCVATTLPYARPQLQVWNITGACNDIIAKEVYIPPRVLIVLLKAMNGRISYTSDQICDLSRKVQGRLADC